MGLRYQSENSTAMWRNLQSKFLEFYEKHFLEIFHGSQ